MIYFSIYCIFLYIFYVIYIFYDRVYIHVLFYVVRNNNGNNIEIKNIFKVG